MDGLTEPAPQSTAEGFKLRAHRPGDVGWIIHRHGVLYAEEYGWDERFEGIVAQVGADFLRSHDPARERLWIAERDGAIAGCVLLVQASSEVAKLRLLLVEPEARGHGLGGRLIDECLAFARAAGYRQVTLWTNSVLVDARRLYLRRGFHCIAAEPHAMFAPSLVGETWELDL